MRVRVGVEVGRGRRRVEGSGSGGGSRGVQEESDGVDTARSRRALTRLFFLNFFLFFFYF